MLNQVYRLVSERHFESFIVSEKIKKDSIIVRPTRLSICHADQRYYAFKRKTEIIKKKLPMALLHEGIGEVVLSNDSSIKIGNRVVMIPNLPVKHDEVVEENYLESSKFRSSSYDGLMQEYIVTSSSRIVLLPNSIPDETAAFIEMMSVSLQAIKRLIKISNSRKNVIGIWGDGNVGYMLGAILKIILPETKLYIFGHHKEKLDYFSFADKTFLTDEIPENIHIDQAMEATGGAGSQNALEQIIKYIHPDGTCVLIGVSEDDIPINTRMVLQKGIRLVGSSRSSKADFINIVSMLKNNRKLINEMNILVDKVINVSSLSDATDAFEYDQKSIFGKTILKWNI